jgi:hypothetical protein
MNDPQSPFFRARSGGTNQHTLKSNRFSSAYYIDKSLTASSLKAEEIAQFSNVANKEKDIANDMMASRRSARRNTERRKLSLTSSGLEAEGAISTSDTDDMSALTIFRPNDNDQDYRITGETTVSSMRHRSQPAKRKQRR